MSQYEHLTKSARGKSILERLCEGVKEMVFEVKIKFLHKDFKKVEIESKDSFTAITKALESLNPTEKDNISAVLITMVL